MVAIGEGRVKASISAEAVDPGLRKRSCGYSNFFAPCLALLSIRARRCSTTARSRRSPTSRGRTWVESIRGSAGRGAGANGCSPERGLKALRLHVQSDRARQSSAGGADRQEGRRRWPLPPLAEGRADGNRRGQRHDARVPATRSSRTSWPTSDSWPRRRRQITNQGRRASSAYARAIVKASLFVRYNPAVSARVLHRSRRWRRGKLIRPRP